VRANTRIIELTGGEPLLNSDTVGVINYICTKWPYTKLNIITNGINLLKYYDKIPIVNINELHVSLDGIKDTHLERRFGDINIPGEIYDNIINGIKKLLKDGVTVKIKTCVDKHNYAEYPEFKSFLESEGITSSPLSVPQVAHVIDYKNPLSIDEGFNDIEDIHKIRDFIYPHLENNPPYLGLSTLYKMMARNDNKPYLPKHIRCKTNSLSNYVFAPNGNIYFCICLSENSGIIGTYHPEISLNESVILGLVNRSVFNNQECRKCPYKFVCLGECPKASEAQHSDMSQMVCGPFNHPEIMNNIEFNYEAVLYRMGASK